MYEVYFGPCDNRSPRALLIDEVPALFLYRITKSLRPNEAYMRQ